ncbi:MAG: SGNH/GDSL hydrolase family protein [Rhodospirillales bacterium]|nr:SGNH/GDSL hydrolase family protein [Rhodospirillales bacterium]
MATLSSQLTKLIGDITGSGPTPATPPPGSPYTTIYSFGDSLSDVGNDYTASAHTVPVSPPYDNGRFTDGPVWVEDLATGMGLPPPRPSLGGGNDFAYGGAYTGSIPGHTANPSDLSYQLTQFKAEDPHPLANALYTVWIGANDLISALGPGHNDFATVNAAIGNEMQFISGLAADGASNILVANVPDLGKTPDAIAAGAAYQAQGSAVSAYFDALLQVNLAAYGIGHPGVHISVLNSYGLLDAAIADPSAFGLTNVTSPLWSGNFIDAKSGTLATSDPKAAAGYLFFDGLHPTATGHQFIAAAAAQVLGVA